MHLATCWFTASANRFTYNWERCREGGENHKTKSLVGVDLSRKNRIGEECVDNRGGGRHRRPTKAVVESED